MRVTMENGDRFVIYGEHGGTVTLKDVTLGKIYTCQGEDEDGDLWFLDDEGERNWAIATFGGIADYVVIVE